MAATYPGDNGPIWEAGYEDLYGNLVTLDADYTCKLVVVKEGESTKTVDRTVTTLNSANTRFVMFLTEAETASLGPGVHNVAIWIINSSAGIKRRKQFTLSILSDALPDPT